MDYLLDATKNEMKRTADELSKETIDDIRMRLLKQLEVYEYAQTLMSSPTVINSQSKTEEEPTEIEPTEEVSEADETEEATKENSDDPIDELARSFEPEKKAYVFEKKLTGGFLMVGSASSNVFVPESVIRDLDIKEGDKVSYEGGLPGGRLSFTVIDKSNRTDSSIVEFNYGIVKYDKDLRKYYVDSDINGRDLRINYSPQRFIINERDEENLSLQIGDVVDIRWYDGGFEKGRVCWKHKTQDIEDKRTSISKRILNHRSPKVEKEEKETIDPLLEGYVITLIGLEPYHDKYKKLIEERGGKLLAHSSKDHPTSRTASIRKSDLVVAGISHTSHDASQHAAKKCKERKIKFTSITGYGGESFLMEVYSKLKIKDELNN